MNTRGKLRPARGAQPAEAQITGSPAIGFLTEAQGSNVNGKKASRPATAGGPLPDAIAGLLAHAEDLAASLCHCAPDREVPAGEVIEVADFITETVLKQAAEREQERVSAQSEPKPHAGRPRSPFAAAMLGMSADRFKGELRARLAAKLSLRDAQPEGVA